jgi:hypothetical protein
MAIGYRGAPDSGVGQKEPRVVRAGRVKFDLWAARRGAARSVGAHILAVS